MAYDLEAIRKHHDDVAAAIDGDDQLWKYAAANAVTDSRITKARAHAARLLAASTSKHESIRKIEAHGALWRETGEQMLKVVDDLRDEARQLTDQVRRLRAMPARSPHSDMAGPYANRGEKFTFH